MKHSITQFIILCIITVALWGIGRPTEAKITFTCEGVTDIPLNECGVLEALYENTKGLTWPWSLENRRVWRTTSRMCALEGVTCDEGHVVKLDLHGSQLHGELPAQIGDLSRLRELNLSSNQLVGEIPPELGKLNHLEILCLNANALSGDIPPELGALTRLHTLDASQNQLSGPIPAEFGALTQLQCLNLAENQLSGAIPAELGNLTALATLNLHHNHLRGQVPAAFSRLVKLTTLTLNNNPLSGAVPAELFALHCLTNLRIEQTQLCIPAVIPYPQWVAGIACVCQAEQELPQTECHALIALYNATGGDYWTVKEEGKPRNEWLQTMSPCTWEGVICQNGHVAGLELDAYHLNGRLPAELGSLPFLARLDLSENPTLHGELPIEITGLAQLETVRIANTGLCEPRNQTFRSWREKLTQFHGSGVPYPLTAQEQYRHWVNMAVIFVLVILWSRVILAPAMVSGGYYACQQIFGAANIRLCGTVEAGARGNILTGGAVMGVLHSVYFGIMSELLWMCVTYPELRYFVVGCGGGILLYAGHALTLRRRKSLPKTPSRLVLDSLVIGGVWGALSGGWIGKGYYRHATLFQELAEFVSQEFFSSAFFANELTGICFFGLFGGLAAILTVFTISVPLNPVYASRLAREIAAWLAPLLSLRRFAPILCRHCLKWTHPLTSRYDNGRRFCEHCQQDVELTDLPGKVVCLFGTFEDAQLASIQSSPRTLLRRDPDFERQDSAIEVSEVHIHPLTADKRLLERFVAYLLNYPPRDGVRSVRVVYHGEPETLGDHLANLLRNTFLPEKTQRIRLRRLRRRMQERIAILPKYFRSMQTHFRATEKSAHVRDDEKPEAPEGAFECLFWNGLIGLMWGLVSGWFLNNTFELSNPWLLWGWVLTWIICGIRRGLRREPVSPWLTAALVFLLVFFIGHLAKEGFQVVREIFQGLREVFQMIRDWFPSSLW